MTILARFDCDIRLKDGTKVNAAYLDDDGFAGFVHTDFLNEESVVFPATLETHPLAACAAIAKLHDRAQKEGTQRQAFLYTPRSGSRVKAGERSPLLAEHYIGKGCYCVSYAGIPLKIQAQGELRIILAAVASTQQEFTDLVVYDAQGVVTVFAGEDWDKTLTLFYRLVKAYCEARNMRKELKKLEEGFFEFARLRNVYYAIPEHSGSFDLFEYLSVNKEDVEVALEKAVGLLRKTELTAAEKEAREAIRSGSFLDLFPKIYFEV